MPDGKVEKSLIRGSLAKVLFALLLAVQSVGLRAAEPVAGVVAVTVYTEDTGRRGTGFVLAPGGEIVTCYHTVVGAGRIEVEINNKSYEARVERLAPNHDLAALRVDLPSGVTGLRLYEGKVEQAFRRDLKIVGHGVGLRHLVTSARMAQEHWVPSEMLRVDGKRLFSSGARLLILEAAAVHDGMSGAPILLGETVVGVLCGSLSEGGDLAWGMDARELFGQGAQRPHWPIRSWPAFTLPRMSQWRSLLRNASLANARGAALVQYFADWDTARASYMNYLATLAQLRETVATAATIIRRGPVPQWLLEEQAGTVADALESLRSAKRNRDDTYMTAFNSGQVIFRQVWDLSTNMPRNQENLAAMDEFLIRMRTHLSEPMESAEQMVARMEESDRDEKRIENITGQVRASASVLADVLGELPGLVDRAWARAIHSGQSDLKLRNNHVVVGKLLFLDVEVKPWVFRGKDYELTFPAGWALVRARDMDKPELAEKIRTFKQFYASQGVPLQLMAGSRDFPKLNVVLGEITQCGRLPGFQPFAIEGASSAWVGELEVGATLLRKIVYACHGTSGYYYECSMPRDKAAAWTSTCLGIVQTMRMH